MVANFPPPGFCSIPPRHRSKDRLCEIYAPDIHANNRDAEKKPSRRPSPTYMSERKPELNECMRAMLVDSLVRVDYIFDLVPGTLHRAVLYIDRFLTAKPIHIADFQLLGAAAILLASKYEDAYTKVKMGADVLAILYGYMKHEVLDMERHIVATLKYDMGGPTAFTFVEHYTSYDEDFMFRCFVHYLAEMSLQHYQFVKFFPSVVAASAVFIARLTLNRNVHPWNEELQRLTGYSMSDLLDCITALYYMQLNRDGLGFDEIRKKYSLVSKILPRIVYVGD